MDKEQSLEPKDVTFTKKNGDNTMRAGFLRLKNEETTEQAVERLGKDGWNTDSQPFIKQGKIIRAVGKRIKGVNKYCKPGEMAKIEYYDIVDSKETISNLKTFFVEGEWVKSSGNAVIIKLKDGIYRHIPVTLIADVIPMAKELPAKELKQKKDKKDKV